MRDQTGGNGTTARWETVGSFPTYAEAERAAEEMAVSDGVARSALVIWPVELRAVDGATTRAANEALARWTTLGGVLGGSLGVAFGVANALMSVLSRPLAVFATLVVAGTTVGMVAGLGTGAVAARAVARTTGGDPLLQASRYELVLDHDAAPSRRAPRDRRPQPVIDLRDASPDEGSRRH